MGSLIATIGLILLAPLLADFALTFGPAEYFALFLLAFATLGGITGKNPMKTVVAACIGLMIATVGIDTTGVQRYTFGVLELYEGVDFIIAIVGLFAISELLFFIEDKAGGGKEKMAVNKLTLSWKDIREIMPSSIRGGILASSPACCRGRAPRWAVSSAIRWKRKSSARRGISARVTRVASQAPRRVTTVPPAVPGAHADPRCTGQRHHRRAAGAADLAEHHPGPLMFTQNADIVWGVIAALLIGNFLLLVLNIPLVGIFVKLLSVPPMYLLPIVTMIAFVGIYSISNTTFDLYFMVAFGVAGYVLRKLEIPLVPVILGLLLGPEMEKNLRHAMDISDGDWTVLWNSSLAIGLWVFAGLGLILPISSGPSCVGG